jgi:hypothetical protein
MNEKDNYSRFICEVKPSNATTEEIVIDLYRLSAFARSNESIATQVVGEYKLEEKSSDSLY